MSIATAITNLTNTIRGIATTKGQIKSAVNTDFEAINNEQIEQYPNLIRNAINQYKSYIPVVTGEGKELSLNTVPLKPKEFALIGDTEQATRILPEGYTQLDYIESDGTQYIDTGFIPDSNTKIDLDVAYTTLTTSVSYVVGAYVANGNRNNIYASSSQAWSAGYGEKYGVSSTTINTDQKYNVILDKNKLYIDGSLAVVLQSQTFNNTVNAYLFARNQGNEVTAFASIKLYRCKIYDNDTLVRDFIPCKNSNNEVGLYDLVTKTFFENQGTGAFTAGNEVLIPNPDYPQDIQVVTGNQTVVKKGKNLYSGSDTVSQKHTYFLDCKVGETYVLSFKAKTTSRNRVFLRTALDKTDPSSATDRTQVYVEDTETLNSYTLTLTSTINGYLFMSLAGGTSTYTFEQIMLEQGSTATDYEPYITPVELPLSLGNMELCKIGDYQDYIYKENGNWYKHRVINKNSYNGTENWNRYYNSNRGGGFYISVSDSISGSLCLCNKFTNDNVHALWFGEVGTFRISDTLNAGFKTTPAGTEPVTKEVWTSELSTSNLILYYPLETPVTEQITDTTLISQLEAIENTNMNNGTTIIYAKNEEGLQPTLFVGAYKKEAA